MKKTLENLYTVFPAQKFTQIDYCDHCHSDQFIEHLFFSNRRDLSSEYLNEYCWSAMSTLGDQDNFMHLLPRVLEYATNSFYQNDFVTDLEVVFSKLHMSKWLDWNPQQVHVIRDYLHQFWESFLLLEPSEKLVLNSNEVLCAIAQCELDLSWYLDYWQALNSHTSKLHAFEFVFSCADGGMFPYLKFDNFWGSSASGTKQVIEWVQDGWIYQQCLDSIDLVSGDEDWKVDIVKKWTNSFISCKTS